MVFISLCVHEICFNAKSLARDPFCVVSIGKAKLQPTLNQRVYLESGNEEENVIHFDVKDATPLRATHIGTASYVMKRRKIRPKRIDLFNEAAKKIGRIVISAEQCFDKDIPRLTLKTIRCFGVANSSKFFIKIGSTEDWTVKKKTKCFKEGDLHLVNQTFNLENYENGRLKISVEELHETACAATVELIMKDIRTGKYHLKDNNGVGMYEIEIEFTRVKLQDVPPQQIQQDDVQENKTTKKEELTLEDVIKQNYTIVDHNVDPGIWRIQCDKANANFIRYIDLLNKKNKEHLLATRQELRLCKAEGQKLKKNNDLLQKQLVRRSEVVDDLDHAIAELKTENEHLKVAVKQFCPHLDQIEIQYKKQKDTGGSLMHMLDGVHGSEIFKAHNIPVQQPEAPMVPPDDDKPTPTKRDSCIIS